jgi:putative membrane protein
MEFGRLRELVATIGAVALMASASSLGGCHSRTSDEQLEQRIEQRLSQADILGGKLEAHVAGDLVVVRGVVDTASDRQRALEVVRETPGVDRVQDAMVVRQPPELTGPLAPAAAIGTSSARADRMYYWDHGAFFGMHVLWWLFWLGLMIAIFSWATPVPRRRMRLYEHPLATLQRRYAAGELTTEEYDERKSRIERDSRDLEHSVYRGAQAQPRAPST